MNDRLELTILRALLESREFARKTLPFLKPEYFQQADRLVFQLIYDFVSKYDNQPTIETLFIELNAKNVPENLFDSSRTLIGSLKSKDSAPDAEWMVEQTETFCKEMAIHNAILESINIIDESKEGKKDVGALPALLQEALAVSFDNHVGHDYLEDSEERFDFYHNTETRIPFDLKLFNEITKGGLPNKTLNVLMAGVGVGKTLAMCHMAAANLMRNLNVLYITLEMAEERISERIDANLLCVKLNNLEKMTRSVFKRRLDKLNQTTKGKLIVKEYPTTTAGVVHFKHLLSELRMKKSFVPHIIYIDYINICVSSRFKMGNAVNSYTYIKSIAEEIRGLAVEMNVPIVTATQFNREGATDTDAGMEKVAESWGLPATADLFLALISTEQLEEMDQMLVKQLKNRYNDLASNRRFIVGIDRSRMRLYDADDSAQQNMAKQVHQNMTTNSPQSVFADTFSKKQETEESLPERLRRSSSERGSRTPREVATVFGD